MAFLIYILVGLVLGAIAKLILGEAMGWLGTIIAGIVGALLGGLIGGFFGKSGNLATDLTNPWGWVFSIIGTILALVIWNFIARGNTTRGTRV